MGGGRFYMFKLEFENQKRNFEIQNQVCFMTRRFQKVCCQTLMIKTWLRDKILENSCLS